MHLGRSTSSTKGSQPIDPAWTIASPQSGRERREETKTRQRSEHQFRLETVTGHRAGVRGRVYRHENNRLLEHGWLNPLDTLLTVARRSTTGPGSTPCAFRASTSFRPPHRASPVADKLQRSLCLVHPEIIPVAVAT
ncbi:hypothetical protein J6590_005628, partial [Homalodisca vitripennis]